MAFKNQINDCDYTKIEYVSQLGNNYTWFVTFNDEYDIKFLYEKKLNLNGEEIVLQDGNNAYSHAKFRILWAKHRTSKVLIESFFRKRNICVKNVEEEYMKEDEDLPGLKTRNGNFIVEILYDRRKMITIESGINYLEDSSQIFITRLGHPPVCLICRKSGHKKNMCPDRNKRCKDCNQIGHLVCTFATKTNQSNNLSNMPDIDEECTIEQITKTSNEIEVVEKIHEIENSPAERQEEKSESVSREVGVKTKFNKLDISKSSEKNVLNKKHKDDLNNTQSDAESNQNENETESDEDENGNATNEDCPSYLDDCSMGNDPIITITGLINEVKSSTNIKNA